MAGSLLANEIVVKRRIRFDVQLTRQACENQRWNVRASIRKDADEPCGAEHQRKAEAIVVATEIAHDQAIRLIEMKIPREFVRGGIPSKSRILSTLLVSQKLDGHFSQNSSLLRSQAAPRKTKALRFAKNPCGIKNFRDNFCNSQGGAA
jgi:hypothetical protein